MPAVRNRLLGFKFVVHRYNFCRSHTLIQSGRLSVGKASLRAYTRSSPI